MNKSKANEILNDDKKKNIIDALEKLKKQEQLKKETWKVRAYTNVLKQLKVHDKPVYKLEDLAGIKGIGKKIEEKIKEILETGELKALEHFNADGKIKLSNDLLQVHGIGPAKAKELINEHNITSIDELHDKTHLLNDVQKLGLKYYKDYNQRIPRTEMVKHDTLIQTKIKSFDPKLHVVLTGSYRRKLSDSGDIDVLITHKDDPEDYETMFKNVGGSKKMFVCLNMLVVQNTMKTALKH